MMTQPRQTHRPPLRQVMETHTTVTGAAYTVKAGDSLVGVNRAGAVTITLPTAEVRAGRVYTVKDESGSAASNNITVATEGSETIDGAATDTISENYGAKAYYSDGTDWFTVPLLPNAAHQASHVSGGADALKLDDLAAPDDNTDLDFSTSLHGLVPKGTNVGDYRKTTAPGAQSLRGPSPGSVETPLKPPPRARPRLTCCLRLPCPSPIPIPLTTTLQPGRLREPPPPSPAV